MSLVTRLKEKWLAILAKATEPVIEKSQMEQAIDIVEQLRFSTVHRLFGSIQKIPAGYANLSICLQEIDIAIRAMEHRTIYRPAAKLEPRLVDPVSFFSFNEVFLTQEAFENFVESSKKLFQLFVAYQSNHSDERSFYYVSRCAVLAYSVCDLVVFLDTFDKEY